MMIKKSSFYQLCFIAIALIPACNCSRNGTQGKHTIINLPDATANDTADTEVVRPAWAPKPIPATVTASGASELSDEMRANLIHNFDAHNKAQNNHDFKTFVNYYYKPMIDILNADSMAAGLHRFYDLGMSYEILEYEIDTISPIVETDSCYMVMLRINAKMDAVFAKKFDNTIYKNPEAMQGVIRDKYPSAIYDAPARRYHINEKMKFYCATSKDTLDFRFIQHDYANSPRLGYLIPYDVFYQLRVYEK